ncbi:MAG: protease modulator HflK [Oscillospiraceae bacterium]|nr:protease modulator HflK [Oscillospiraceae bacterium]MCL1952962.1 protease modulator HflK [Oscillospiraceae bacterium]
MNAKQFEAFTQILKQTMKYFKWVMLAAAILVLLSGVYRVDSNEAAVVLRFGRLAGSSPQTQVKRPGIHFALPFFIDQVIKVPVRTVHEKEIVTHYGTSSGFVDEDIARNGYLLTGDHNVLLVRAKVKYKIGDAVRYALYSCDAESAIDGILSGELTRAVTHAEIDAMLTSDKARLSSDMMARTQEILDGLRTGIDIVSVELTELVPPAQTRQDFEAVINASVDKETKIQQAKESASTVTLGAEAGASEYKQAALSDQSVRLAKARDEIAQFNGVYEQYRKNPGVIQNGVFRQRVSEVLGRMGASVILPDGTAAPVIVLP